MKLRPKEREILDVLKKNCDRFVPAEEIFSAAWSQEPVSSYDARTLAVHICGLRKKIAPNRILSSRGSGYRFIEGL